MKAIAFKVSFFESLFKVHYTKAFKLSYPTLLPTSVLGFIGNICGYDRRELPGLLKNFYFGSSYLSGESIEENITFIQFKKEEGNKYRSGVVKVKIYNESEHILIVAGDENELREKIINKIKKIESEYYEDRYGKWYLIKMHRYPYGGQNDFFARDIRLLDSFLDVEERDEITGGYVDSELIKNIDEGTDVEILPVRVKGMDSKPIMRYYAFIKRGKIYLNKKILTVLGIPIYSIDSFYYSTRPLVKTKVKTKK